MFLSAEVVGLHFLDDPRVKLAPLLVEMLEIFLDGHSLVYDDWLAQLVVVLLVHYILVIVIVTQATVHSSWCFN